MRFFLALLLTVRVFASASPTEPSTFPIRLPAVGDASLRILSPSVLELTFVTAPEPNIIPPLPNLVPDLFEVTIGEKRVSIEATGFKRRVLYAPVKHRDLRVGNYVYLTLAEPIDLNAKKPTVKARAPKTKLWPDETVFTAAADPLRATPVIHLNQEGYSPEHPKIAMVGYYLGSLGELPIPANAEFKLLDAKSGQAVFTGNLKRRRDVGFTYSPAPYQNVWEADFTAHKTPGEYRLAIDGFGASTPFRIDEGMMMSFTRTYALGLYHQRCGVGNEMPFTRFTHGECHRAPAEIPLPASSFSKAWDIIAKLNDKNPNPAAPHLKDERSQLYPFVRRGKIDVAGGHHDAGDYSKYTSNSTALIHPLMLAVDAFPGVAELDNLGLPESGDGISDILQEVKWEADFLSKMQDDDGGFYFLVYPRDRRYEDGPPDQGDRQIVWPKNTAVTAAAVAALAQCASSPAFKKHFPPEAKRYLEQAERGWSFLLKAIAKHGQAGAYQKLTHYGDNFTHDDELAWAACELFLATGNTFYQDKLFEWFADPTDAEKRQWGWVRASFYYGNAMRSYAFGARSGRLPAEKLDALYLKSCEAELLRAGDDIAQWSNDSAYGTSLDPNTKRHRRGGWYFSSDKAFDATVAHAIQPRKEYAGAVVANINYEIGCNPVNISFLAGLGLQRPREIVHQYAQADRRVLPPSGLPLGSIAADFHYMDHYKTQLRQVSFPPDDTANAPYPIYDRWSDAYNVTAEFVIQNQGRSLASLAYWAAQAPAKSTKWKSAKAEIEVPAKRVALHKPITVKLKVSDLDLALARVTWEARDQEPAIGGTTFTFTPKSAGAQWVEAEAHFPDGRRVCAAAEFNANSPVVLWIDGALPKGAEPLTTGGDTWEWKKASAKPADLARRQTSQHESTGAGPLHEHGFDNAIDTLAVERGDILFAYAFIDPKNPPKEIMLNWNDGTWEHRALWGEDIISYGEHNSPGRRKMGKLPKKGEWVRLEVPASLVALEGRTVKGMVFSVHGGRVLWDAAGKMTKGAKELKIFPVPKE